MNFYTLQLANKTQVVSALTGGLLKVEMDKQRQNEHNNPERTGVFEELNKDFR